MLKNILNLYKNQSIKDKFIAYLRYKFIPWNKIDSYFNKKDIILDLGCGQGICTNIIKLNYPNSKIIGFDFDSKKINIANKTIKNRKNISFNYADIIKLNLKKYKPNKILVVDTISTLPKQKHLKLFKNCYKALSKNGLLIIKSIDTKPKIKYLLNYLQSYILLKVFKTSKYLKFYYPDSISLKKALTDIGFDVKLLRLDKFSYIPHFLCVAKKK